MTDGTLSDEVKGLLQALVEHGNYGSVRGYLGKLKPNSKNDFQRRYFELQGGMLLYDAKEGIDVTHPKGVIPLTGASVTCPDPSAPNFMISSNSRAFTLRADTIEQRDKWLTVLKAVAVLTPSTIKSLIVSALKADNPDFSAPADPRASLKWRTSGLQAPESTLQTTDDNDNDSVGQDKDSDAGDTKEPDGDKNLDDTSQSKDSEVHNHVMTPAPVAIVQQEVCTQTEQRTLEPSPEPAQAPAPEPVHDPQVAEQLANALEQVETAKTKIIDLESNVEILQKQLEMTLGVLAENVDTLNSFARTAPPESNSTLGRMVPQPDAVTELQVWNLPRKLVSGKKRRTSGNGFDLDLVYITDRIIGMGLPSQGLEAMYRNPYSQTLNFLDTKHRDKYVVYNLCSEQQCDTERFHGRWHRFGFDDHTPPPIRVARRICEAAQHYLSQHNDSVVAVHCKAGKGRTGTVICMMLQHLHICPSAAEAIKLFEQRRMEGGRALNNPGQVRYVNYYERALREGFPSKRLARLHSVRLFTTPRDTQGGCTPYILVTCNQYDKYEVHFDSRTKAQPVFEKDKTVIEFEIGLEFLGGDVRVEVYTQNALLSDTRLCRYFFHPAFETSPFVLEKSQIDEAYSDKKHSVFAQDFKIETTFSFLQDGNGTVSESDS